MKQRRDSLKTGRADRPPGSWSMISNAAVGDARLGHAAFRVLAVLARHADEHGYCHPSHQLIGLQIGITAGQVKRLIRKLRDFGYVEVDRHAKNASGHWLNRYRLRFPDWKWSPPLSDLGAGEAADASSSIAMQGSVGSPLDANQGGIQCSIGGDQVGLNSAIDQVQGSDLRPSNGAPSAPLTRLSNQKEETKRSLVIWAIERGIPFPSVTDRYVQALVKQQLVTIEQARKSGFYVEVQQ